MSAGSGIGSGPSKRLISSKVSTVRGICASLFPYCGLDTPGGCAKTVEQDYVIMWRQKASGVVFGEDVVAFSISPVLFVAGNDDLV